MRIGVRADLRRIARERRERDVGRGLLVLAALTQHPWVVASVLVCSREPLRRACVRDPSGELTLAPRIPPVTERRPHSAARAKVPHRCSLFSRSDQLGAPLRTVLLLTLPVHESRRGALATVQRDVCAKEIWNFYLLSAVLSA